MEGRLRFEIIDPQDVLVDRYVNPWDLESARRSTHTGIFRTLSDVERNAIYDRSAIAALKAFFASEKGLITAAQTRRWPPTSQSASKTWACLTLRCRSSAKPTSSSTSAR
jgi:hypothetical protein